MALIRALIALWGPEPSSVPGVQVWIWVIPDTGRGCEKAGVPGGGNIPQPLWDLARKTPRIPQEFQQVKHCTGATAGTNPLGRGFFQGGQLANPAALV